MPYLVNVIELLDVFVNYTGNQTRNRRFILHKTIREFSIIDAGYVSFHDKWEDSLQDKWHVLKS